MFQKATHHLAAKEINTAHHIIDCTAGVITDAISLCRYAWMQSARVSDANRTRAEGMPLDSEGLLNLNMDEATDHHLKIRITAKKIGIGLQMQLTN